jgi:hypothetical protein
VNENPEMKMGTAVAGNFVKTWLLGYHSPAGMAEGLKAGAAPHWGLMAVALRALMISLLVYLPASLMGRIPPTPPWLPFIPAERYYAALVWLTPPVLLLQWLLDGAAIHLGLRLAGRPGGMDQALNLAGMASLVIGAFVVAWDWAWFSIGGMNQYLLGASHLAIDAWWIVLVAAGLKRNMGVPVRLALLLILAAFVADLPLGLMIMRSPF